MSKAYKWRHNIGLNNATGDYISFIDSDDIISLNLYEKVHKILIQNQVDILVFNGIFYDNKTKKIQNKKFFDISIIKNYKNEQTIYTYKDFDNIFFLQNSVAIKIYKHLGETVATKQTHQTQELGLMPYSKKKRKTE